MRRKKLKREQAASKPGIISLFWIANSLPGQNKFAVMLLRELSYKVIEMARYSASLMLRNAPFLQNSL